MDAETPSLSIQTGGTITLCTIRTSIVSRTVKCPNKLG